MAKHARKHTFTKKAKAAKVGDLVDTMDRRGGVAGMRFCPVCGKEL
jgi:hypothetical protein